MFNRFHFCTLISILFMAISVPAFAVDLDDDLKPDTNEHIVYEASATSTAQSAEVEKKFPEEAAQVREAIQHHLNHANTLDIEGYLSDFLPERVRDLELDRDYAQRAMALKGLKLEIHSIEFAKLNRTSATVHTQQIASYVDESGNKIVDDAIISYRWLKDANDQIWKIAFTERKRLVTEK